MDTKPRWCPLPQTHDPGLRAIYKKYMSANRFALGKWKPSESFGSDEQFYGSDPATRVRRGRTLSLAESTSGCPSFLRLDPSNTTPWTKCPSQKPCIGAGFNPQVALWGSHGLQAPTEIGTHLEGILGPCPQQKQCPNQAKQTRFRYFRLQNAAQTQQHSRANYRA